MTETLIGKEVHHVLFNLNAFVKAVVNDEEVIIIPKEKVFHDMFPEGFQARRSLLMLV